MKTKFYYYLTSLVIIIAVFILVTTLSSYTPQPTIVYEISPKLCTTILGVEPVEFCDTKGANTILFNGFTSAEVNKNGNLILSLTEKELFYWKNSRVDLQILQKVVGEERNIGIKPTPPSDKIMKLLYDNAEQSCGFEISDDYTKIIANPGDDITYFAVIPSACIAMQLFNGKQSDEITVEYVETNEDGEIVKRIIWPTLPEEVTE